MKRPSKLIFNRSTNNKPIINNRELQVNNMYTEVWHKNHGVYTYYNRHFFAYVIIIIIYSYLYGAPSV